MRTKYEIVLHRIALHCIESTRFFNGLKIIHVNSCLFFFYGINLHLHYSKEPSVLLLINSHYFVRATIQSEAEE